MPFVRAWKEHGLRRLAPFAAELVAARIERPAVDVITHVPSDPVRQLRRAGYPAEALAAALGRHWRLEHTPLLRRARPAGRQAALPLAGRTANMRGAFVATRTAPRRVLLVDDVYTSGSTATAAATALRRAGAERIEVVTFARTLR